MTVDERASPNAAGRVVARLSHSAAPPVDSHVYDEWTSEVEAEAAEAAALAGLEPSFDGSLDGPMPAPAEAAATTPGWAAWVVAGLGAGALLAGLGSVFAVSLAVIAAFLLA